MIETQPPRTALAILLLAFLVPLGGCSDSGDGGKPGSGGTSCEDGRQSFNSTFEGIQEVIFEKHGCTQDLCHGSARSGGLDLSPDNAHANIFEMPSQGSAFRLIEPGDNDRSYLWLKLAAKTNPGSVQIAGSPMPNNLPALSTDELELLRLWIYAGAPKDGTVRGTEKLLNACLPEPKPITVEPLDPPAPSDGLQFVMPPWKLAAESEFEGCMATYYDFSEVVPKEYRATIPRSRLPDDLAQYRGDGTGSIEFFRFSGFELRQDPQSHHLLLYYSPANLQPGGIDVNHPSFGAWTCQGGPTEGAGCDPKNLTACGEGGVCSSKLESSFACVGFGPRASAPAEIVGGAGQAQAYLTFADGVWSQLPIRGVLYWNTHAFNLSKLDHTMNGRVNYSYAKQQTHQVLRVSNFGAIFRPNNPPFTKETFCNDHVFPIGSRVFHLFAHTHQHGEHFWATAPDGTKIYESFDYSDPVQQRYDPPLAFDSPNPAERTVRYCAVYNNGVAPDGSPDVELVTRASRVPQSARESIGGCRPVACVAGRVGAPCRGEDDDAACDSSPGAGDGFCDACPITGGESTQNEMFVLFGAQYIDPTVPGAETHLLPYPGELE